MKLRTKVIHLLGGLTREEAELLRLGTLNAMEAAIHDVRQHNKRLLPMRIEWKDSSIGGMEQAIAEARREKPGAYAKRRRRS